VLEAPLALHHPLGEPLGLALEARQPGVARLDRRLDLFWVVATKGAPETLLRHEPDPKGAGGRQTSLNHDPLTKQIRA
jgi:hypothetical protein